MFTRSKEASLAAIVLVAAAVRVMAGSGEPDLVTAVKSGNLPAVRALARTRGAVNARDVDGTTALHWAAYRSDDRAATVLVGAGADLNAVNRYGQTPLSLAAASGSADLVRLLVKAGAEVGTADAALPDRQTTLMLAARTGSVGALRVLLEHGAMVNAAETRTGTTALMWAALENRPDAVRVLVEAGADVNLRSRVTDYPHTPPGVIGDKVEAGASYVGQTVLPKGGWTALMYAARQGALESARALADAGADLNATDPDGSSALIFAIINGHYDVAALVADKGADVNLPDRAGMSPLYAAVDMHTMPTTFGRPDPTPVVIAGAVDAAKMLVAHGANPNARLKSKIIKRVYNPGDSKLDEGATPFMRAAKGGDVTMMRLLKDAGADPTLSQKNGNTALHLAAALGPKGGSDNNPDRGTAADAMNAIKLCIELGADLNAVNAAGDTAVHAALASPAAIQYLADHGAKLDVKNKQGRTPLAAALRARDVNQATVALLRRLTGDTTTQAPAADPSGPNRRQAPADDQ